MFKLKNWNILAFWRYFRFRYE